MTKGTCNLALQIECFLNILFGFITCIQLTKSFVESVCNGKGKFLLSHSSGRVRFFTAGLGRSLRCTLPSQPFMNFVWWMTELHSYQMCEQNRFNKRGQDVKSNVVRDMLLMIWRNVWPSDEISNKTYWLVASVICLGTLSLSIQIKIPTEPWVRKPRPRLNRDFGVAFHTCTW